MEVTLVRALAAAARAFADEIERGLPPDALAADAHPTPGSPRSMFEVLSSVSQINDRQSRGATDDEIRVIARRAGLDPRGMAGYYAANLLEKRDDGTRWVSIAGRERQLGLSRVVLLDPHGPPQERPQAAPATRPATDFDALYASASPPWEIGRPQPAFLHLAESGALKGRVLDIGCGTGEHALMAADLGLPTTGVDASPTAIGLAKRKAAERKNDRNSDVRFLVWDAMELAALGEQFDTVLDSGLFHIFDDADRARYVASLQALVAPQGRYFMLCFSERMPGTIGPRRISQQEIRTAFGPADGWQVESIEPATFEVTFGPGAAPAWLASITRLADDVKKARSE
jgi:SAM-dependent methyltransferase